MPNDLWLPGPAAPVLAENEVHVWRAQLDRSPAELDRFRAHLSGDELERAASFRFDQHRNRYVAGRGILRELMARYLAKPPTEFVFGYNSHGKPSVGNDLRFNVSHSHELALFAFAHTEIGVDVERSRPELAGQDIAERFFAPEESNVLMTLPLSERTEAFFRCWTRKEAFVKAHGKGLSLPLSQFVVEFTREARLVSTAFDRAEAQRWSLYGLEPRPGYAGALAAEGRGHVVRLFTIPE